jgi:methylaspartate ammonia-lyase
VVDNAQVYWGDCIGAFYQNRLVYPPADLFGEILNLLELEIVPRLEGQSLDSFRRLMSRVDRVLERSIENKSRDPVGQEENQIGEGWAAWTQPPPPPLDWRFPPDRLSETDWITRSIRFGLSQAILKAVAAQNRCSEAEVLAKEYRISPAKSPVPLQVKFDSLQPKVGNLLAGGLVSSIGVTAPLNDPAGILGREGERLQRSMRLLKENLDLVGMNQNEFTIHLDVRGGLGDIFRYDSGRILGALVGLEQVLSPYPLQVENLVVMPDLSAQIQKLGEIKNYINIRNMNVQLVADAWCDSLENVLEISKSGAVDLVHVQMSRLGRIDSALQAIAACKAADVGVILAGASTQGDDWARLTCNLALATQPAYLSINQSTESVPTYPWYHAEMTRTLAGIAVRRI